MRCCGGQAGVVCEPLAARALWVKRNADAWTKQRLHAQEARSRARPTDGPETNIVVATNCCEAQLGWVSRERVRPPTARVRALQRQRRPQQRVV